MNCTHPSDTDTVIRVDDHPRASYFIVSENGDIFVPSSLTMDEDELCGDILAATVMVVADVQIKE